MQLDEGNYNLSTKCWRDWNATSQITSLKMGKIDHTKIGFNICFSRMVHQYAGNALDGTLQNGKARGKRLRRDYKFEYFTIFEGLFSIIQASISPKKETPFDLTPPEQSQRRCIETTICRT